MGSGCSLGGIQLRYVHRIGTGHTIGHAIDHLVAGINAVASELRTIGNRQAIGIDDGVAGSHAGHIQIIGGGDFNTTVAVIAQGDVLTGYKVGGVVVLIQGFDVYAIYLGHHFLHCRVGTGQAVLTRLTQIHRIVGHVVGIWSAHSDGHRIATCRSGSPIRVDGVNILAISTRSPTYLGNVSALHHFGTSGTNSSIHRVLTGVANVASRYLVGSGVVARRTAQHRGYRITCGIQIIAQRRYRLVGGKQLAPVNGIGTGAAYTTRRQIGNSALCTSSAHTHRGHRRLTGKVVGLLIHASASRAHRCGRGGTCAQCHRTILCGLRIGTQR